MSTKTELLALLAQKEGRYASGQELADTLGVSRNAIWKAVKALQEQGYAIESLPSTGYRLRQKADILTRDAISARPCTFRSSSTFSTRWTPRIIMPRLSRSFPCRSLSFLRNRLPDAAG